MGRLDRGALRASGENQAAATRRGTMARSKLIAHQNTSVGGSWRPWLVTVVVVVGAMVIISGVSQLAAKASSPSIAQSDR